MLQAGDRGQNIGHQYLTLCECYCCRGMYFIHANHICHKKLIYGYQSQKPAKNTLEIYHIFNKPLFIL